MYRLLLTITTVKDIFSFLALFSLPHIQTAFFEIPKNSKHGMDLTCSFPACRNGGVKFLYCKFCDEVIAKRTFRTHHAHEDLVKTQSEGTKNVNTATNILDVSNHRPSQEKVEEAPKKRRKRNQDLSSYDDAANSDHGDSGENFRESASESSVSSSSPGSIEDEEEENGSSDYIANEDSVEAMRAQWDALLDERQNLDSKDDISEWLDRVVDTSERFQKASRRSKKKSS